jgi:Gas vesicle synthesis protein GvpL/GvpF
VIHVYAFVDELDGLPGVDGVGGAPLEALCAAGLTAVASRLDRDGGDPRAAAVEHGLVVEALLDAAPAVLPVRFGERFATAADLDAAVAERAPALRSALERVRGCAEIAVRVTPAAAPRAAASGTDYLYARLADEAKLAALGERLRPFAQASAEAAGGNVAYLVRRSDAEPALVAARAFADEHPDVDVSWTGPWAPYSFAGGVS